MRHGLVLVRAALLPMRPTLSRAASGRALQFGDRAVDHHLPGRCGIGSQPLPQAAQPAAAPTRKAPAGGAPGSRGAVVVPLSLSPLPRPGAPTNPHRRRVAATCSANRSSSSPPAPQHDQRSTPRSSIPWITGGRLSSRRYWSPPSALPHQGADLLVSHGKIFQELCVGGSLLERREISRWRFPRPPRPGLSARRWSEEARDLAHPATCKYAPPPFAGDQHISPSTRAHHHRLEDPDLGDARRQRLDRVLVELVRGWSGLGVINSNGKWCNDPGPGPDGISESSPRPSPLRLVTIYGPPVCGV